MCFCTNKFLCDDDYSLETTMTNRRVNLKTNTFAGNLTIGRLAQGGKQNYLEHRYQYNHNKLQDIPYSRRGGKKMGPTYKGRPGIRPGKL